MSHKRPSASKYVIFDNGLTEYLIILPNAVQHSEINAPGQVISAGFIEWDDERGWHCYGKSVSLEVTARPQDSLLANRQLPSPR